MMKKKRQILLTCGISIFIFLILFYFLSQSAIEKEYNIFLINQDISAGEKIEKTMLSSIAIPQTCVLPQACKNADEIIGKILLNDLKKGDLLSVRDLIASQNGIIYPSLHKGMILYTLSLKAEDANGWWIAKGNRIKLYVSKETEQGSSFENQSNTIEIIESARIIRIMDETGVEIKQDLIKQPKMVCLEVSTEEAQILFLAEGTRKIKLLAMNP